MHSAQILNALPLPPSYYSDEVTESLIKRIKRIKRYATTNISRTKSQRDWLIGAYVAGSPYINSLRNHYNYTTKPKNEDVIAFTVQGLEATVSYASDIEEEEETETEEE